MLEKILGPLAARWAWLATALRVQSRFGELNGNYLASAVTLNLFTSMFPALLVGVAIVGFFTNRDAAFSASVLDSLGLSGEGRAMVEDALTKAAESRKAASLIGFLGLLWAGLGVAAAIEHAFDRTWQHTGGGIKDKGRAVVWGTGALLILGGSIAVTAVVDYFLPPVFNVLVLIVAVALNAAFALWTFKVLSHQKLSWRAYLPGAVLAGIGLEIIKQASSLLGQLLGGSSALYGSIGVVFGILAVMLIFGRLLVYSSVLNVIRWEEDNGTVTVEIDVPKVPGEVPTETDRSGAVDPE